MGLRLQGFKEWKLHVVWVEQRYTRIERIGVSLSLAGRHTD